MARWLRSSWCLISDDPAHAVDLSCRTSGDHLSHVDANQDDVTTLQGIEQGAHLR